MMEPMIPVASVLSPLDWRNYLVDEDRYHQEIPAYGEQAAAARACLRRIYELTAQLNEMLSTAATYQVPLAIRINGRSDSRSGFDLVILEDTLAQERVE